MPNITVHIPSMLADCANGSRQLAVNVATLGMALSAIQSQYPLLAHHLFLESGERRRHILIFLNDQNINFLDDADVTALRDNDQLHIVPAVSGGY